MLPVEILLRNRAPAKRGVPVIFGGLFLLLARPLLLGLARVGAAVLCLSLHAWLLRARSTIVLTHIVSKVHTLGTLRGWAGGGGGGGGEEIVNRLFALA